jgi:hypothetical protein
MRCSLYHKWAFLNLLGFWFFGYLYSLRIGSGSFLGFVFKIYYFDPIAISFSIMGVYQNCQVFPGKEIISNLLF